MVTVFHYTPVNAKQFGRLNVDGLAGKYQKRQNFPRQNVALYGKPKIKTVSKTTGQLDHFWLLNYLVMLNKPKM